MRWLIIWHINMDKDPGQKREISLPPSPGEAGEAEAGSPCHPNVTAIFSVCKMESISIVF